jgi:hypothetical protein
VLAASVFVDDCRTLSTLGRIKLYEKSGGVKLGNSHWTQQPSAIEFAALFFRIHEGMEATRG